MDLKNNVLGIELVKRNPNISGFEIYYEIIKRLNLLRFTRSFRLWAVRVKATLSNGFN